MSEDFESYKKELDRVRLAEESKRALAESLSRHKVRPFSRPRRWKAGAGKIAAIAAVLCLLMTGAVATVVGNPTLRDSVFGGGAGYSQSSGFIGRSVEKDGWTVTITDCVGDDRNLYLGIEVEAPEGVVLDEDSYRFMDCIDNFIQGGGSGGMRGLPDDDPTDNKIYFMARYYKLDSTGFHGSRFVLKKLIHGFRTGEGGRPTYEIDCDADWDFGYLTVEYPDSTIRLEPGVFITTLGVEAAVTSVEVSPLSVLVRIEGSALENHHDWVSKDAPDGWYGCIEYQEVFLYTEGGGVIPVNYEDGAKCGGGCSEGAREGDMTAFVKLDRTFDELVDVDSLTAISVCGVMIPLR